MSDSRTYGVVAAGHRLTAEAGAQTLREGGNAVDAAIAALAMACVCEPVLCSPGGGGFAMFRRSAGGPIALLDFFPQTPVERRRPDDVGVWPVLADFGTAVQEFRIGPATAATPGFFPGLHAMAAAGGSVAVEDLVAPAIGAARDGVEITEFQHYLTTVVQPIVTATESARQLFAPDGVLRGPGTVLTNPSLADAFEAAAVRGLDSPVVQAMIDNQRDRGHLAAEDFATYRVHQRVPLTVALRDSRVFLNPLPAASGVLIEHSLRATSSSDPVEVARAFAATSRARAGAEGDVSALARLRVRQKGTTHISVIDSEGGACAVTISNGEGNGEVVDGMGFMLNNVLGEEDVNPAGVDRWPLDVRLSSMMSPSLIETPDGGIVALGSGGSNRIRTAIAQVVLRLCADGLDLDAAIHAPRLHVEGAHLDFEDLFDDAATEELRSEFPDHRAWPDRNLFYGGVHAAAIDAGGRVSGVGDRRRDGTAIIAAD